MNKNIKLQLYCQLLIILNIIPVYANGLTIKNLNMQKNLSNYSVMALYQDERGLIWMGTRNGINVYDGTYIQTYQASQQDSSSIMHNQITDIQGDKNGTVYILSHQGVSMYFISEDRYETITQKDVTAINLHNNKLLMAVDNKILCYNAREKNITDFYTLPETHTSITNFCVQGDTLAIGTELNGLYIYDLARQQLTNPIRNSRVSKLFIDSDHEIWVGSWKQGVYRIKGQKIINHTHSFQDQSSLSSNFVRTFCEDEHGNIWVGTFHGLNRFDKNKGTFDTAINDTENGLTNTSVWSLLCDAQGTVWVGTYFDGVSYFNPKPSFRCYFQSEVQNGKQITVGEMTQDNDGNLWICTDGNGLCKLNLETNETKWYKHHIARNSISQDNVKSISFDSEENVLWIGTHMGGLNKFDLKTERFTNYLSHPAYKQEDKSNTICDILPLGDELILATHAGVFTFNKKTEMYQSVFNSPSDSLRVDFAFDLQIDSDSILWISGDKKGLFSYDLRKKVLSTYSKESSENKISGNIVNCSYKDSKNRLWLCMAESGIELYNAENKTFTNFNVKDNHLLNNCVYGVCEISPDKFIFTMDNGVAYLDMKNNTFRNFLAGENIPLQALNQNAVYRASNGDIYIGGINGMISFKTDVLNRHPKDYSIFPLKMYVHDKEIKVNDDTKILSKSLSVTKKIKLNYQQSMFSIVYSTPNYVSAYKDEIVYKLENFSHTWSVLRPDNYITYTNLNPGVYKLIVKTNSKTGGAGGMSELEIEILPPWYRTLWAWGIYVILLVTVSYVIIRVYKNRLKLQAALAYEHKHSEDVENLNRQKLQFFTNISHEFRTPLTLIISEVELLMQVKSFLPAVYNRILTIYKSSMQLQSLISELLDFRKQELGHMHIKVSKQNLVRFVRENYLLFKEYAMTKNIDFLFEHDSDEILLYYDEKQLQKVMNNLLSNAFSRTPANEKIIIHIDEQESVVNISVVNTGTVIEPRDIGRIFDRFYQSDAERNSTHMTTGIGLALTKAIVELHHGTISVSSSQEMGTCFKVVLLKGKKHFKDEELNFSPVICECQSDKLKLAQINEMEEQPEIHEDANKKYKILIVEDDANLLKVLTDIFNPYYQTYKADCGEKALEILANVQPDIIISDILMPGISGLELCKRIKKSLDTCHIPVVLLTAKTGLEYKLEGLNTNADDYIIKPFDTNILLARCRNLIHNRIILQEKFTSQPQEAAQVFATNKLDKVFMDKALQIIEENIENNNFSTTIFAQEMAIARTKLFTKIKAITGQTPNELIITMRLKRAAFLLRNNVELSITEISEKAGFKTPRYFSRCFKGKYMVTPLNYRKGKRPDDPDVNNGDTEEEPIY